MFFADSIFIPGEKGELVALASSAADAAAPLPPADLGTSLIKMVLTLIAVILLLFASYWFLRRLIQNRLQRGVGKQRIDVIEKRMISPKTMLYLVQVDQKQVLLAESHLEIKALETFTVPDNDH